MKSFNHVIHNLQSRYYVVRIRNVKNSGAGRGEEEGKGKQENDHDKDGIGYVRFGVRRTNRNNQEACAISIEFIPKNQHFPAGKCRCRFFLLRRRWHWIARHSTQSPKVSIRSRVIGLLVCAFAVVCAQRSATSLSSARTVPSGGGKSARREARAQARETVHR